MKLNPRKLALAGLIAAGVSDFVYKIGLSSINPEDPAGKIEIPFFQTTSVIKEMSGSKIIAFHETTNKPIFIPHFVSVYILLFVAGSVYNKRKD